MAPGKIGDDDCWSLDSEEAESRGASWPTMTGEMAWDGRYLDSSKYMCELSNGDIEEIEIAVQTFKGLLPVPRMQGPTLLKQPRPRS
jgi:hypothetical protein